MKTRTRGNGTLGGSVETGRYNKSQCDWERSLERMGGKDSFIEQEIINHPINFAENSHFVNTLHDSLKKSPARKAYTGRCPIFRDRKSGHMITFGGGGGGGGGEV
jgi:hypothetical protein